MVAVPHGDGAEAARQRIIAAIIVLELVRVLQVEGKGAIFAVDLKGVVVLRPLGVSA